MEHQKAPVQQPTPTGAAIREWLEADHKRLEELLHLATEGNGTIDRKRYDEFRTGLLRHINIEEKILFPAAMKSNVLEQAAQLRLDHGALAALLVLDPSHTVTHALRTVLAKHNNLEEGNEGVYEECITLIGDLAGSVFANLEASPNIPLAIRAQGEKITDAAKRCLERAGYPGSLLGD
ncbi:MAG: hemerythrin domain-containing protein [Bacteroidetes bacterium]|nr:hemerythrin domain-containing protein [Bacteroidota bacterium]